MLVEAEVSRLEGRLSHLEAELADLRNARADDASPISPMLAASRRLGFHSSGAGPIPPCSTTIRSTWPRSAKWLTHEDLSALVFTLDSSTTIK